MPKKKLLDITDVAEMLNVSETTVRQLVKRKELAPPRKVGGRSARWFRKDVAAYLAFLRLQPGDADFACAKPRQGTQNRAKPQSAGGADLGS